MYKVYCDNFLLYDSRIENLKIQNPKVSIELNKTGTFSFTIYTDHPYINFIRKLKSIITVYQGDFLIFRGRPLNIESGFYNQMFIDCEGELAFLVDSIQRPYEFNGSVEDYLSMLLDTHNSQADENHRFMLGDVTVIDDNDYITRSSIDHVTVWDEINQKLISNLGGYLWVRHSNGVNYLDYLEDFDILSSQKIEFAKNLLDLKRKRNGDEIATALIPLGAKLKDEEGADTDERLTIEAVNEGKDYIQDDEAVAEFGFICKTQVWDDVTQPLNLLRKGQAALGLSKTQDETIELSAADLATVNANFSSFRLGAYVPVSSEPHGINQRFLVTKLAIDLLNPAANNLTLGGVVISFTDKTTQAIKDMAEGKNGKDGKDGTDATIISETPPEDIMSLWLDMSVTPPLLKSYNDDTGSWEALNDTSSLDEAIQALESFSTTELEKLESSFNATLTDGYYKKGEVDEVIQSTESKIMASSSELYLQFTNFVSDLTNLSSDTNARFEELQKYIRFSAEGMELGESKNPLVLKLVNDRISFVYSGAEVAYFSENKLYVTDGQFLNSLQLGNFGFIPLANGSLSFKKVV